MENQPGQRFTIQRDFTSKEKKNSSVFLSDWTKTTKSRFGLKLYKFTPKKPAQSCKANHSPKYNEVNGEIKQSPEEENSHMLQLLTPVKEQKSKEKKMRSTYAKEDSESSQYHPSKKTRIQKKRMEKAKMKSQNEPISKALVF